MSDYKVLILDDEVNILNCLKRVLRSPNYQIISTTSVVEALEILKRENIAVILSDHRMPEMDGNEFMALAKKIKKNAIRIVLTGSSNSNAVIDYINSTSVYRFLTKPWVDIEIKDSVENGVKLFKKEEEFREFTKLVESQNDELMQLNVSLERRVYSRTQRLKELNSSLEGTLSSVVEMLLKMVSMNSNTIAKHSKRVGSLVRVFGKSLSLTSLEIFELELAGNLHDIGKIGLPDKLLLKPHDSLVGSQKLLLESHCSRGQIILNQIGYFKNVSKIIMQHHERWDGMGYPRGIRENEICRSAQILHLVDHFDKFMNGKDGFGKKSVEDGIKHLECKAGTFFDPSLVQSFRKYLSNNIYATDVEIEVSIRDLEAGMVISRGITTQNQVLLLPTETEITKEHIDKLHKYQKIDPIVGGIYVYRKIRYALQEFEEELHA
ncbi:response regulator [bacterium]|nr:response regulator [bacterium]